MIWNFIPGSAPDYNTVVDLSLGNALVAGAGFSSWTYRVGFDVSLPAYSPLVEKLEDGKYSRTWLAVSAQTNLHQDYNRELSAMGELVRLGVCKEGGYKFRCLGDQKYEYPKVLQVCFNFKINS